ncbi:MAG TPA: hypothetical protein VJJ78_04260 [Candidatus Saccharimonadales bacterium]|nr:hypothetical protein [Candidatus Saccharimonadales bacterium]
MKAPFKLSPHTVLSLLILVVYASVIALNRSWILTAAVAALVVSTVGHSLLHLRTSSLKRDTLIEYLIVLIIGILLIISL